MFEEGRGCEMSKEKAFSLYEMAAKQGNTQAQYSLGKLTLIYNCIVLYRL